jgi:oxamate amidohydrolase
MARANRVAVAAPHGAALEAARAAVAAGGGAIDAAIAGAAALAVAYPHQCSVGGDMIALVHDGGSAETTAVVSVGAAPSAIDVETLRAEGDRMPASGPLTVTVPGAVAGWHALHGAGARVEFGDLMQSAIRLAREGTEVSPGMARAIHQRATVIDADPGLAALVRPGGRPLAAGEPIQQPALETTLESIAEDPEGYYTGDLARRVAAGLRALGSPISVEDLAAHRVDLTAPLTGEIGGARWSVAPPPSQGAALLGTLTAAGSSPDPAALVRAARSAELRRDAHLGDPRGGPIDLEALLGSADVPAGMPTGAKPAGDTVAVTAVDDSGTAVSLIMSVFQSFGSGLLDPDTGIVFHNRGSAFSLDPTHPGVVRPGIRPPHTLSPALVETGDADTATLVALGCQGGRAQAWILAQLASEVATTRDPVGLLGRPRWVIGARDLGLDRPGIKLEPGAPEDAAVAATELGLAVHRWDAPDDEAGHAQLARLRLGLHGPVLDAASDPRADGDGVVL